MNNILALVTGLLLSLMIFCNGSLELLVGREVSLLFIHLTAFALISLSCVKKVKFESHTKHHPIYLTAGLIGILVLLITNSVFAKGGVLLTLSGTLTGQMLAASSVELKRGHTFSKGKTISIILIVLSSFLLGLTNKLPLLWIILSWVPGALIFLQSFMNSKNIQSKGQRVTLLFHYGTVVAVILPLCLYFYFKGAYDLQMIGATPALFLYGGGLIGIVTTGMSGWLLLKISPVVYVLILYCGQIAGAVTIDLVTTGNLSYEKVGVIIILLLGLILNYLSEKNVKLDG